MRSLRPLAAAPIAGSHDTYIFRECIMIVKCWRGIPQHTKATLDDCKRGQPWCKYPCAVQLVAACYLATPTLQSCRASHSTLKVIQFPKGHSAATGCGAAAAWAAFLPPLWRSFTLMVRCDVGLRILYALHSRHATTQAHFSNIYSTGGCYTT